MGNPNIKIHILAVEKNQVRIPENLVSLLILLITHWLPLGKPNDFSMPQFPSRKNVVRKGLFYPEP